MQDIEKICRGIYNAEMGQCQIDDGAVSDTAGGVQTRGGYETVGSGDPTNLSIRISLDGGRSSFGYSGLVEGRTSLSLNEGETSGPLDLQVCWSDKKNQQCLCSEFSSFPSPFVDNRSAGLTYRLSARNFGAHVAAGWTSARFNDPTLPSQIASAVFNGGVNVHGRPAGGFTLGGVEYFLVCNTPNGICDAKTLHQLGLQGLTTYPLSPTQRLFFSADLFLTPDGEFHLPTAVRFQGNWDGEEKIFSEDHFSAGVRFRRQAPLFETEPLDRLSLFLKEGVPIRNGMEGGIELEGTPVLLREGLENRGHDFQLAPFLNLHPIAQIGGHYRSAVLPTGGKFQELGGILESSAYLPIERLRLFASVSEFLWEDPLFEKPRGGFNIESGGIYCLGDFCFDLTGQYNRRTQGDPFPNGEEERWNVMAGFRYQDQPGRSSDFSDISRRRLAAHGFEAVSAHYPIPHYASPRLLYNPSPLPGGVWPFNIPKRRDGAKTFDAGAWYEKTHPNIAELRQSNPAAVETWIKRGHGNALKELLAQGVDGACATCHVDKYGMMILKEWIDGERVAKSFLDVSNQIPNPWYSAAEAKKAGEAGQDYPYPETVMMAGAVRCQKEGCHSTDHTGYLRHILDIEGGRHHGVDALSQVFEYSLPDKSNYQGLICYGCHEGPGSDVNRDIHGFISTQPLIACEFCHTQQGPFNHASKKWGPAAHSGGDHGKVYWQEAKTRGVNNVSCRSCHEPTFCTACHARMNTHGQTQMERRAWGWGGRHSFSGVALAQGTAFVNANRERGNNCWVCHESQQNCFDPCHSGERVTGHRFHPAGMINRHQAELDLLALRCHSCHQEKKGVTAVAATSHQINCRECHTAAITEQPRPNPPHPVGWANRRAGQRTMHGEAVCDRGGPGVCFQCHSFDERRNPEGPLSCFNSTCHGSLKTDGHNIPLCGDRN